VAHVNLVLGEGREGADVRRALGHDDVAGIAEHPGDEIQRLLGPFGDDHVAARAMDALVAHEVGEHLTQPRVSLAAGVLQGRRALLGHDLVEHITHGVEGERRRERHASGQADDLRSGGDGEQGPDLGSGHRAGAAGVAVTKGVIGAHDLEG
jgi:hypothetical protein